MKNKLKYEAGFLFDSMLEAWEQFQDEREFECSGANWEHAFWNNLQLRPANDDGLIDGEIMYLSNDEVDDDIFIENLEKQVIEMVDSLLDQGYAHFNISLDDRMDMFNEPTETYACLKIWEQ